MKIKHLVVALLLALSPIAGLFLSRYINAVGPENGVIAMSIVLYIVVSTLYLCIDLEGKV